MVARSAISSCQKTRMRRCNKRYKPYRSSWHSYSSSLLYHIGTKPSPLEVLAQSWGIGCSRRWKRSRVVPAYAGHLTYDNEMSPLKIFLLVMVFLATSAVSVITGSTSLITVPPCFNSMWSQESH